MKVFDWHMGSEVKHYCFRLMFYVYLSVMMGMAYTVRHYSTLYALAKAKRGKRE